MNDLLGDYFKIKEKSFDLTLDPTKITIIRLDGIRFHNFTKPFYYPYDPFLRYSLEFSLLKVLCSEFKGYVSHVYFQSDEASIIIPPVELPNQLPFSGRINKVISILLQWNLYFYKELQTLLDKAFNSVNFNYPNDLNESMKQFIRKIEVLSKKKTLEEFDKYFESEYWYQLDEFLNEKQNYPAFDCRIFQVETKEDVIRYLTWRRVDAIRNFKNSLGFCFYSPKQLKGMSAEEIKRKVEIEYDIKYKELPKIIKRGSLYQFQKYQNWIEHGFEENDKDSNDFQKNIIMHIQNWNELFIMGIEK
jgi:tRNA(His) 5'-end guanylyltransferase